MPFLAALLLSQIAPPPARPELEPELKAERLSLLKEMREAKEVEIRRTDGAPNPSKRFFRRGEVPREAAEGEGEGEGEGFVLISALEADFLKRPNATQFRCGFHPDIAILAKGERTLRAELCFTCGAVRIEVPGSKTPHFVWWAIVSPKQMRTEVRAVFSDIRLGREW